MSVAQSRVRRCRQRQDLRHRRPTGHGFILSATNTDVVEEYNPVSDTWSAPKERMPTPRSGGAWGTDGRKIYVAGGEVTTKEVVGAFRAIEAYEPASNTGRRSPCRCHVMASREP
jgi:hypothetical protein